MSFWVDNLIKSNERSKQRLQTVNYSCRGGRKVYEFEYCCSITIAVMVTTYPHSIVKLLFSRSNTFLLLHGNLLWNSNTHKMASYDVRVSSKLRSGICGIKSGSDIVFVWIEIILRTKEYYISDCRQSFIV